MRNPASNDIISDSVELCDAEVCCFCTSNWWAHMCENQRYTKLLQMLISNLQDLQQSLSLGITQIDNAVPCSPHDNIDDSHSRDEYRKSALPIVCHIPESILWLILQACSRTTRCQVVQFVPRTRISRQFARKLLTILQLIQVPPVWIDDHLNKDAKLRDVAPLSLLPIHHNTFASKSLHVVGPRYCLCVRFLPPK